MRATTQLDVAKAAGVSQRAVASVVGRGSSANGARVSEETRRLILEAAERLNYRPHLQAQLMRGVKSGTIGVIKSVGMAQYHMEKAFYATDEIVAAGYSVVSSDHINRVGLERSIDLLLDARVEGVLLVGFNSELRDLPLQKLKRSGMPTVALPGGGIPSFPSVVTDHRQGMYDLVMHLQKRGHRRLLHATLKVNNEEEGSYFMTHHERVQGFFDGIEESGNCTGSLMEVPFESVISAERLFDRNFPGVYVANQLLEDPDNLPDAILCSNDDWAIGLIAALGRAGLKLPGQIGVTGFDGSSIGQYTLPSLTTVSQPTRELARRGVEMLFRLIGGATLSEEERLVRVPGELVVRESCGRGKS